MAWIPSPPHQSDPNGNKMCELERIQVWLQVREVVIFRLCRSPVLSTLQARGYNWPLAEKYCQLGSFRGFVVHCLLRVVTH